VIGFIITMLVIGVIAGYLARLLVPGRDPMGFVQTVVLGVVGSFVGGFIGRALNIYHEGEPAGFVMSLLGAILLVAGYHFVARRALA
jgi:uncharacterized membrane protein YeaQ/YmgE (transglycosylase-associated protein family)